MMRLATVSLSQTQKTKFVTMPKTVDFTLPVNEAKKVVEKVLRMKGCDKENARAVTDVMIRVEIDGCVFHGLFRLPGYIASLESGKVNGSARPDIKHLLPSVLRVDGNGGFAPLVLEEVRPVLIQAAQTHGIVAASLINTHHFAALWCEVEPLAEAGLCALACTNYLPAVAPFGGRRPFFGTNPMAFGWPREGKPPFVFDQASAAMARGDLMLAAKANETVPDGIGLDQNGQQTTDPSEILNGGVMLPFGRHKGSSIAIMVELLTAGLCGAPFSHEAAAADNGDGGPPKGGEFILAIDPSKFGDPNWLAHSDSFFEELSGLHGVRLPGSRRHTRRGETDMITFSLAQDLAREL